MPDYVVYSVPGSPYGRAVLATLLEKGAPFRVVSVPPQELGGDAHRARHAFARVPAIEHDGFTLYETQAILRYIDRLSPDRPLSPADPRAAARMDQIMAICDWYLFQGVGNVIAYQRIVGPKLMGLAPDETVIAEAMPRAHIVFAELARLLGERPFIAGDDFTLADLMVAPQLAFLAMTPEWEALTAERPRLCAWLERIEQRPSFEATTWPRVAAMAVA